MKVLVACEMSGRVTDALLELGVDAWSCDLLPTIGQHPERHMRSKISPFLARAMAAQWAHILRG